MQHDQKCRACLSLMLSILLAVACKPRPTSPGDLQDSDITLNENEHLITIVGTNDIHGGIEPSFESGDPIGGMSAWASTVAAIRQGMSRVYPGRSGLVLVDAGDQFQGSLLSNFDEGKTTLSIMRAIGYDAVVPGNHDYDFGPVGWLEDSVSASTAAVARNPRGALLAALDGLDFPLLSANTFYKASLKSLSTGRVVAVNGSYCAPLDGNEGINWSTAERPAWVRPYQILNKGGLRIALIGLDHPSTPTTTVSSNVADLCFRDPLTTYLDLYQSLATQADIFVVGIHDSDLAGRDVSKMVREIRASGSHLHAVIAGHTHRVERNDVDGVPIVQSGSGGRMYGMVDLVYNAQTRSVDPAKSRVKSGIKIYHKKCDPQLADICQSDDLQGVTLYREPMVQQPSVEQLIDAARSHIAHLRGRRLARAGGKVNKDFNKDSAMARFLTDTLRETLQSDIALINTGTIRSTFDAGEVLYEDLFDVMPFATRAVKVGPASTGTLVKIFDAAVSGTKPYGALMQSGLIIAVERQNNTNRVRTISLADGTLLFDRERGVVNNRDFVIGTSDFMMGVESGAEHLKDLPYLTSDAGVIREIVADQLTSAESLRNIPAEIDGRWIMPR